MDKKIKKTDFELAEEILNYYCSFEKKKLLTERIVVQKKINSWQYKEINSGTIIPIFAMIIVSMITVSATAIFKGIDIINVYGSFLKGKSPASDFTIGGILSDNSKIIDSSVKQLNGEVYPALIIGIVIIFLIFEGVTRFLHSRKGTYSNKLECINTILTNYDEFHKSKDDTVSRNTKDLLNTEENKYSNSPISDSPLTVNFNFSGIIGLIGKKLLERKKK